MYAKHAGTNSVGPFTLLAAPYTNAALTISVDGTALPKDGSAYTVVGNQITFASPVPLVSYWEEELIQPISMGSVTDESITANQIKTSETTAIRNKLGAAPLASPTFTGTVGGITKAMVGLGSVDNTADSAKPISALTQAALNLKYGASNILGTVSQSSGVPTGAVIETGSNANGRYMRLADGTQICWMPIQISTLVAFTYNSGNYNLPATFINATFTCVGNLAAPSSNQNIFASAIATSTTQFAVYARSESPLPAFTVNVIAIGRWF